MEVLKKIASTKKTKNGIIYSYPVSHSYIAPTGEKIQFLTQLYSIGIYGILHVDGYENQSGYVPKQLVDISNKVQKDCAKENIEVSWGRIIHVMEKNGFWEEIQID